MSREALRRLANKFKRQADDAWHRGIDTDAKQLDELAEKARAKAEQVEQRNDEQRVGADAKS